MEQLDHRQLLSVNFTGIVQNDFPASQSPGVVVLPFNASASVQQPAIPITPPALRLIHVSGFAIQDIRVSYDSTNDTLYIGLNAASSGNTGQPGEVIAGDSDDNGNSATVNPAIPAIVVETSLRADHPVRQTSWTRPMGGSEYMAAFLDFTGSGNPQVVAGFSARPGRPTPTNPTPGKPYRGGGGQYLQSRGLPAFGAPLPQFTGTVYLVQNSPNAPNLEFSITHFSQLYQMETGQALTSTSVVGIGGFAGSLDDTGIGELTFFRTAGQHRRRGQPDSDANPQPISTCPPQSPVIFVNPHEHRIIDTLHRDLIRVTIEGTSGFNVNDINPSTVTLDGVHAVAHITRKTQRDEFPFATYVFVADQLNLPPGLDNVTLSGTLNNGVTQFSSTTAVLNIPNSGSRVFGRLHGYMGGGSIYHALSKIEAKHPGTVAIPSSSATAVSVSKNPNASGVAKLKVSYSPVLTASPSKSSAKAHVETPRQVISIKRAEKDAEPSSKLPTLLRHSLSEHLDRLGSASSAA